jgi:hypothetical protein
MPDMFEDRRETGISVGYNKLNKRLRADDTSRLLSISAQVRDINASTTRACGRRDSLNSIPDGDDMFTTPARGRRDSLDSIENEDTR